MNYENAKRIHDITPNEFHYLLELRNGNVDPRLKLLCNLPSLRNRGLMVDDLPDGDALLFIHDVTMSVEKLPMEEFCEKYYELFPKGVRSGGYPVRDGLTNVIKKMTQFRKEYSDLTDEDILSATERYVKDKKKEGYAFMKLASHLIYKDRTSTLVGLIEENKESKPDEGNKWGRTV